MWCTLAPVKSELHWESVADVTHTQKQFVMIFLLPVQYGQQQPFADQAVKPLEKCSTKGANGANFWQWWFLRIFCLRYLMAWNLLCGPSIKVCDILLLCGNCGWGIEAPSSATEPATTFLWAPNPIHLIVDPAFHSSDGEAPIASKTKTRKLSVAERG